MDISPKRLIMALALVFLLGVAFAIVNGMYTQEKGESLPLIVYAISLVSLFLGGSLVILFQWKINKMQLERVTKILPSDERKVVLALMQNGNSMEQNRLVALTGLNKVKISRLVKELEQRDVVAKTDLGNTNLIVLKI
jgi:uncharacterized membrane protein